MNWDQMTYDQQRALLGLPDVRSYVARYKLRSAVARVTAAMSQFGSALRWGVNRPLQSDYALAGPEGGSDV